MKQKKTTKYKTKTTIGKAKTNQSNDCNKLGFYVGVGIGIGLVIGGFLVASVGPEEAVSVVVSEAKKAFTS